MLSCEGLLPLLSLRGWPGVRPLQGTPGLTFGLTTGVSGNFRNVVILVLQPDGETTALLNEPCCLSWGAAVHLLQLQFGFLVTQ